MRIPVDPLRKARDLPNTYRFLDKDPVIDQLRTLFQESGMTLADIEAACGVRADTVSRWFTGKVRWPQHKTVVFVLRAMGYEYGIQPIPASRRTH